MNRSSRNSDSSSSSNNNRGSHSRDVNSSPNTSGSSHSIKIVIVGIVERKCVYYEPESTIKVDQIIALLGWGVGRGGLGGGQVDTGGAYSGVMGP